MPEFRSRYQIAKQTIATTTKAIFAFDADANQYPRIGVNFFGWDPTGASMVKVELRRRGTDDGTKSAAVTWVPDDATKTATPKTAGYTYSVQPTNDGAVVATAVVPSNQRGQIINWPCEKGGKYTVFVTTAASVDVQAEATLEE